MSKKIRRLCSSVCLIPFPAAETLKASSRFFASGPSLRYYITSFDLSLYRHLGILFYENSVYIFHAQAYQRTLVWRFWDTSRTPSPLWTYVWRLSKLGSRNSQQRSVSINDASAAPNVTLLAISVHHFVKYFFKFIGRMSRDLHANCNLAIKKSTRCFNPHFWLSSRLVYVLG